MSDSTNFEIHAPLKVLLVYPEFPPTFWNFKHALQFTDQKSLYPPLGLLTVASMLPKEWEKKLIDLNTEQLEDEHLKWADYVFVGAMDIQKKSAVEVIDRCKKIGAKIVAGGPFFTEHHEDFESVNHLVLGEAETTLPIFLEDLERNSPKHLYLPGGWPDIEKTALPMHSLIDVKNYSLMCVQYSRGCPFDCEFCQITRLFGRKVRTKTKEQVIQELESLYELGWRETVFFVDDNFIGNKHKLKTEILPAIIEWTEKRNNPFKFFTQVSINLADDEELMQMMARAGFYVVFVGIETPDDDCLTETGKFHNRNRDLVANVKKIQRFGLEVKGGFIVGFDNDKETIFDRMTQFIQESGIVTAMVGLLTIAKGTKLYDRIKGEKRLISDIVGSNTDFTLNFIPKMDGETLLDGYRKILKNIYSVEPYYLRISTFLSEYKLPEIEIKGRSPSHSSNLKKVKNLVKTMVILGILDEGRVQYWKLFFWTLFRRPQLFQRVIGLWAQGYHFRKIFKI